ncbi:MAG: type I-A CRISPR-associated protein Csa5 [Candidatus Korarchaeota archaeon]|nr:type I-A CRISPR-associated protein Csa5 [Candidatus Korarchaeota archaeon]
MPGSELSKVLAALLIHQGDYSFVDKLGYAPNSGLAVLYLKEALRDLHSLMSGGKLSDVVESIVNDIDWDKVDKEIGEISTIKDRKELREKVSLIAAGALAKAAKSSQGG